MLFKFTAFALVLSFTCTEVLSACERDRNVKIKDPMYLNYGDGFFYMWESNEKLSSGAQWWRAEKIIFCFSQSWTHEWWIGCDVQASWRREDLRAVHVQGWKVHLRDSLLLRWEGTVRVHKWETIPILWDCCDCDFVFQILTSPTRQTSTSQTKSASWRTELAMKSNTTSAREALEYSTISVNKLKLTFCQAPQSRRLQHWECASSTRNSTTLESRTWKCKIDWKLSRIPSSSSFLQQELLEERAELHSVHHQTSTFLINRRSIHTENFRQKVPQHHIRDSYRWVRLQWSRRPWIWDVDTRKFL